jgi:Sulfotransferase domain
MLRVIGAGPPRTGTSSLKLALSQLLNGRCCHMSEIPGHPFDLGPVWGRAIVGGGLDVDKALDGFVACVDWPASMFWREISEENPGAAILLSTRPAEAWLESMEATILPYARLASSPDWAQGRDLVALLQSFTGRVDWDEPGLLVGTFEAHVRRVRAECPTDKLVEWSPELGWAPICDALGLAVPDEPFPWENRREDWQ